MIHNVDIEQIRKDNEHFGINIIWSAIYPYENQEFSQFIYIQHVDSKDSKIPGLTKKVHCSASYLWDSLKKIWVLGCN